MATLPGMSYPGGKSGSGVYQTLINQIPPHDVYVALYGGHDAVMRHKRPAERNVLLDLDPAPLDWWTQAARRDLELWQCDAVEWVRHQFGLYRYQATGRGGPVPDSAAQASAGKKGGPRAATFAAASAEVVQNGDPAGPPNSLSVDRLSALAAAEYSAAEFEALAGRAAKIAGGRPTQGGKADVQTWFLYADPPYPMSTRTSGPIYQHEMTDEGHQRLLDTLRRVDALVMVSSYPNDLYDRCLAGWRTVDFWATVRSGEKRQERLWMNYPEPQRLHDYRYVGGDKRQRERIRKRSRNWAAELARLDPAERGAILQNIEEVLFTNEARRTQ